MKLQDLQKLPRKEAFTLIEKTVELSPKITPLDKLSRMVYTLLTEGDN